MTEPKGTTRSSRSKKRRTRRQSSGEKELRFIPLGGVGEIGKNMYVLEYGEDIMVVDSGLMFPDEDMLGIDFVIPDITWLEQNKSRVRGIVLTHGHEDHIGALPFVLPKLDCPLYGTRLTLGMVRHKLGEAVPDYKLEDHEIQAGETISLGVFEITFFAVCHSIPDGVGLIIRTPLGNVVHTGDFKLDPTPIDGRMTDYNAFSRIGEEGVLLLLSDSTNVERGGFTPSERVVGRTLDQVFRLHKTKRIVMAAFASNLHRVQQMCDVAARFNRKVALMGRSMVNNVELARKLGYLTAEDDLFLAPGDVDSYPPNRVTVITTGSQGEPFSGLVLMSKGEHRYLNLGAKDLVVVNATPIPGNEKLVSHTINRLFARGCEVIYEADKDVHVSGHASREELKIVLSMVRPKYFVPIHGEYRMLVRHAQLAEEVGVAPKNAFVLQTGDVLALSASGARQKDPVPSGAVLVDGMALGEMEGSLLRERRDLSEDGVLMISLVVDRRFRLAAPPVIESQGTVHLRDARELEHDVENAVHAAVESVAQNRDRSAESLSQQVRNRVRSAMRSHVRSTPVIVPLVSVLSEGDA